MSKLYDQYGNHTGSIGDFDGSRAKIYDEYGNHTGYIERSGSSRDKLLDQYGNHTGYIEKTGGSRDKLLDQYGNRTGYIERSGGSRDKILDEFGNHTGYIERSGGGISQSPNEYGKYTGYSSSSSRSSSSGGGAGVGCLTWLITAVVIIAMCVGGFKFLHAWVNGYGLFERDGEFVEEEEVITPVYTGKQECGEGVWYILDEQGNMTISGNGQMKNYNEAGEEYPWASFKNAIKTLRTEEGVQGEIPKRAFSCCENLTSVVISGRVEVIGEQVFYECIRLKTVSLPAGVTTIDSFAFGDCATIKEIVLPNSVKTIGNGAFLRCEALESIEAGNSLEHIAFYAFEGCKNLTSMRLPKTLNLIDSADAFQEAGITDIYYEGSESEWRNITYLGNSTVGERMREFTAMGITVHYNAG